MILLSLVLALLLVRWIQLPASHWVMRLKPKSWIESYLGAMHQKLKDHWDALWAFALVYLLPAGVVIVVSALLTHFFGQMSYLLYAALVLWACLPDFASLLPNQQQEANQLVVTAHEQLFTVVFWFVLLGPAGALLYHLLTLLQTLAKHRSPQVDAWGGALSSLHAILSWIPARLTALFFALVGNFDTGFTCWRQMALQPKVSGENLVIACAHASLASQNAQQNLSAQLQVLIERASFIWVVVLTVVAMMR